MSKRIMVVDDNPDMVELLRLRFELSDYLVVAAGDGLEAIEMVQKESPDLIILDVMLPKVNGYDVCRRLKLDKLYEMIPIIMLTARAQDADREISKNAGADAFLSKPFNGDELMGKVEEFLAKRNN